MPKGDGRTRLCGDYKVTVNSSLKVDQYPLPKPNELFASLAGGKRFAKLGLTQAYQQMPLQLELQKLVVINTHQGLYRYTRLPFGIAPASAIFQRTTDTILQGLPHVLCFIDILITGPTEEEHLQNLENVLKRLQHHGVTVKQRKCAFMQEAVDYLGHRVDAEGLPAQASLEKVEAIQRAPLPRNQQQLRSFLRLIQYYGNFLPDLATTLSPLNRLLQKTVRWNWTADCEETLHEPRKHYNPGLPLRLAADASAYGVGAVISHAYPDSLERPITYASRTLTSSEKNYAQIEKEALSLVYGVKKFHQFLYGRQFTLFTDHKPLTVILGPKKGVLPLAVARLQCWALLLSAYDFQIAYKPTKAHANADGLYRLPAAPSPSTAFPSPKTCRPDLEVFNMRQMEAIPVTSEQLRMATRRDPILSRVVTYTKRGWPPAHQLPEVLRPYSNRRNELTIENECGVRVIVPKKLQVSRAPSKSSQHWPNESLGQKLCLVAQTGPRPGASSQELYPVSTSEELSSRGPAAPLALAFATVATDPCGFRWTSWKAHLPHRG